MDKIYLGGTKNVNGSEEDILTILNVSHHLTKVVFSELWILRSVCQIKRNILILRFIFQMSNYLSYF